MSEFNGDPTLKASWTSRHPKLAILGGILVLLAIVLALFDWNWLRGPVQRMATSKTERTVTIGHLNVRWGWPPVIELRNLHVANMAGGDTGEMIAAEKLDVAVGIPGLFHGDVVIPHIWLSGAQIRLQRLADGRVNWTFGKPAEPGKGTVRVLGLSVEHGQIDYADRVSDIDVNVQAATGPSRLNDSPRHRSLTTQLSFKGHYGPTHFNGDASTGDVLSLQETGKKFPLLTQFTLGKTRISADGEITDLLKPTAIDALLSVAGPDLAALYPALPVVLPSSPSYRFAGRFTMQGKTYAYQNFTGVIGRSDIAGGATYTARSPRPHLATNLHSKYLDLDDLGPLIGVKKNAVQTADPEKDEDPKVKKASTRVLPQSPFKLDRLNAMDADVTLDVKKLRVPDELPLEDLHATLKVDAGVLTLSPLKLGVADGDIVANIMLDGRADPIKVDASIDISHAKLAQLFPTVKMMKESDGAVGAKVHLVGQGNSLAAMLGSSSGTAQLAMSGGTVSNLLMEGVGLDGGEIIKFLVRGDEQTPIRCAGASFKLENGVANSEVIVFDTGDTRVDGAGKVDMKNEKFDILLKPQPKDRSILSLRVPVRLHGSFAAPGYSIDKRELLLRGGAAVALGFVNPLLALIPLIETGPGSNTDCTEVFRATSSAVKDGKTDEREDGKSAARSASKVAGKTRGAHL